MRHFYTIVMITVLFSCNAPKNGQKSTPELPPPKPALIEKSVYDIEVLRKDSTNFYIVSVIRIHENGRGMPLVTENDSLPLHSEYILDIHKQYKVVVEAPPRSFGKNYIHWNLLDIIKQNS